MFVVVLVTLHSLSATKREICEQASMCWGILVEAAEGILSEIVVTELKGACNGIVSCISRHKTDSVPFLSYVKLVLHSKYLDLHHLMLWK